MSRLRLVCSVVGALALIPLAAGPASANTVTHGSKGCPPDTQVQLSETQRVSASVTFTWVDSAGHSHSTPPSPKGTSFTVNTGLRSVTSWKVVSGTTVGASGAGCV